jgi:hypothetical protein
MMVCIAIGVLPIKALQEQYQPLQDLEKEKAALLARLENLEMLFGGN